MFRADRLCTYILDKCEIVIVSYSGVRPLKSQCLVQYIFALQLSMHIVPNKPVSSTYLYYPFLKIIEEKQLQNVTETRNPSNRTAERLRTQHMQI